jgi:hypothetical protein
MAQENLVSETFALLGAARSERPTEADYRSFSEALGASARGRAFLHEYARRNRHADTEVVLAALARLEQTARAHQSAPEAERIRQDLRALLETVRGAKPQIDNSPGAIKAATLAAMLEFVQARLEALITPREAFAEVPAPEQPELPIPQPSPMPTVLALVQAAMAAPPPPRAPLPAATVAPVADVNVTAFKPEMRAPAQPRSGKIIPEVNFFDNAARTPAEPAPAVHAPTPAAEPVGPAEKKADAAKPEIEPYELWLDPGPAEPPGQEPRHEGKPAPQEPTADAHVEADLTADLLVGTPVELPVSTQVAALPAPVTAIAALAASFAKPGETNPVEAKSVQAKSAEAKSAAAITPATVKPQAIVYPGSRPAQAAAAKSSDPLALIMALSAAERLALFT